MNIKEVIKYNINYAEYIVTDGENDLICMCLSVPLKSGNVPKSGMKVITLDAFSFSQIIVEKMEPKKSMNSIVKGKEWFEYTLCGSIDDLEQAIVKVGEFRISLKNNYENGFNKDKFKLFDEIKFHVDRLDATLID